MSGDDDWETDPDYVNVLSERERRTVGSKTHVDGQKAFLAEQAVLAEIGKKAMEEDAERRRQEYDAKAKFSRGYGGSYGIEPIRDPQTGRILEQPQPGQKK
eukprot:EC721968.1.p1 GENE.EC721968.1~~EC721968.1.p1  ORF type:complete len:114 (+),score=23.76 EC721968.1:41-343(+)